MAKKQKSLELSEAILIENFGIEQLDTTAIPLLREWIAVDMSNKKLNDAENYMFNMAHKKLIKNMSFWNEEELKMNFISMIIALAEFEDPIKSYYDREMSAMVEGVFLSCKADMLLSKGIKELIKTPYFFLHEYKREKKYSGDPIGQMLGGMLIAQAQNNNGKPIYGCYVQGRFWFFSILESKQYVISKAFDASEKEEALQIVFILRKLKQIILERLMD
ncbi:MAG TPA: hypothetical protein PKH93_07400 [Chitinophagales bacterium]|nr:hypothetical protein [Chitinophagales bacterium]